jgi:predicted nucleic-acid-binding protein
MATAIPIGPAFPDPVVETTLLELVRVVSEVTEDDREVVATVMEMLRSGRVRLCGTLRNAVLDAA